MPAARSTECGDSLLAAENLLKKHILLENVTLLPMLNVLAASVLKSLYNEKCCRSWYLVSPQWETASWEEQPCWKRSTWLPPRFRAFSTNSAVACCRWERPALRGGTAWSKSVIGEGEKKDIKKVRLRKENKEIEKETEIERRMKRHPEKFTLRELKVRSTTQKLLKQSNGSR